MALLLAETQTVAEGMGLVAQPVEVRLGASASELDNALDAIVQARPDGLVVLPTASTPFLNHRLRIAHFAAQQRIPAMYSDFDVERDGGLMSLTPDYLDMRRRAARQVDRILKDARPADVPVEQPTVFQFALNLRAAEDLGLTIPERVLVQATEVIR
jgi:putative ABC transport system substrate-binding protein